MGSKVNIGKIIREQQSGVQSRMKRVCRRALTFAPPRLHCPRNLVGIERGVRGAIRACGDAGDALGGSAGKSPVQHINAAPV